MTKFIFYDLETTGINVKFDQILQFGAILTDRDLMEIDRFEIRCRLLPWVVPAPSALLLSASNVEQLDDPVLPDFYSMMLQIFRRLNAWGPATFVGYNSMPFDEPFLQRAFWQALLPPYLTVTGGNSRLDILPLLRATDTFRPGLLTIPRSDDGSLTYRLDKIAPSNGFDAHNAHDAIGDVEATLFLARKLKADFTAFWEKLARRTSKASVTAILNSGEPFFLYHHRATSPMSCYWRLDSGFGLNSHAILAPLSFDWAGAGMSSVDNKELMRSLLRSVALNKAPIVLTLAEAESFAGVVPTDAELAQASFLASNRSYCSDIAELTAPFSVSSSARDAPVEETIFDGFASASDVKLMAEFQIAGPRGQLAISKAFSDSRFLRLATRILYVRSPGILARGDVKQIESGIYWRLKGKPDGQPWRSLADAMIELASTSDDLTFEAKRCISEWLAERATYVN